MKTSTNTLMQFLQKEYIMNPNMGSGNMSTAIRDLLTDLIHLGDEFGVNIANRLNDASEVYEEELKQQIQQIRKQD